MVSKGELNALYVVLATKTLMFVELTRLGYRILKVDIIDASF